MLKKIASAINGSDANGLKSVLYRRGTKRFIHRQLLVRLIVAAAIISVFLAAMVFLFEYRRLGSLVNNRAAEVVANFNSQLQQLDHGIDENREEIQQELKMLLIAGKSRPLAGQLIYSSIYDLDGRLIASETDGGHVGVESFTELVKSIEPKIPVRRQSFRRIKGTPYLHLSFPLYDKTGKQAAFIEGIFEVSAKARQEVTGRIAKSLFGAIGIVLLTTMILYPVISRLISQLTILAGNLVESNIETLRVIGSAIAKRDSDTDSHNYRVTIYSVELAERIGLHPDIIQGLIKGAFLHDVGKIGISDRILLKPARLSSEEFAAMKLHVQHGVDIVKQSGWLKDAVNVVGYHHEKFAGDGYPTGLKGHEIPVNARIFAIADVFDALTSTRPYKERLSFKQSMEILNRDSGTHFDPLFLDRFNEIAKVLYEKYAHGSDQVLYEKMEAIIFKYFSKEYRYGGQ
ncbi:HD-GYP domain-containing protein [Desulforhopalus singaporensis]|uniref:Response regulator c-di-GMP phosphodiesterase, RpfG family, contains REC and HD-GYP domains n=1 Tax=Desulforhopalus singaporensis TaxID=91360 RepID=A0A1H0RLX6_9BACT|nr:HD-GYP domain-containing protein [Desulforhopalus singaporensis]SDP30465.1 Response regulator c-di-GMP phosphodiesterase, RpfG family, contains REC and HD-GYP domains [Desulforhopalus singaporensis]